MVLESLEDLLTIDTDKNKAEDNKRLLTKIKQLLKSQNKEVKSNEELAEDLPYEAVSVVGNRHITLRFDLESKKAAVFKVEQDERKQDYMALYHANNLLKDISRRQR